MKRSFRPSQVCAIATLLFVTWNAERAFALTITFSDSLVSSFSIVDDDANDLNATPGVIDFSLDGTQVPGLEGTGRAQEFVGPIGTSLKMSGAEPGPSAILRNTNAVDMNVAVTVNSSPYGPLGSPLGWRLNYDGYVADPAPDAVSVSGHSLHLSVNGTDDLATAFVPDISDSGDPPIAFSVAGPAGSNAALQAASSALSLLVTLGPGDEILLAADPEDYDLAVRAYVFNNDARCVYRMNTGAAKVVYRELRSDAICLKALVGSGGDAGTCVDVVASTADAVKLANDFATGCDPLPPWGASSDPATISGAAQSAATDVSHDVFGPPVHISSDANVAKCQTRLLGTVSKGVTKAWKAFAKCKKSNFLSISNDADLASTCLPDAAFTMVLDAIQAKLQFTTDKCIALGVSIGDHGSGRCNAAPDSAAFAGCLADRVRCRLCQAFNVADDVDAPGFDCDAFDNGTADSSCSGVSGATTTTTTTMP